MIEKNVTIFFFVQKRAKSQKMLQFFFWSIRMLQFKSDINDLNEYILFTFF